MHSRFLIIRIFRYLFLMAMSIISVVVVSLSAYGTEDVEVEDDDELRLPTQRVTARRVTGGSSGISSLISIVKAGSYSDLSNLTLTGDEYTFAVACQKDPNSLSCRLLACELDPDSAECEQRLDKVVVNANRPDESELDIDLTYNVEFRFNWKFTIFESSERSESERKRKKLEKECRTGLKNLFASKKDFSLKPLIGSKKSSWYGGLTVNSMIKKIIKQTKPIMTTGVDGRSPVDHQNGLEAGTGFYLHKETIGFSRGNVNYSNIVGIVRQYFEKDPQWQETLENSSERAQDVVVGFHTHPTAVPPSFGRQVTPIYAWGSPLDFYSHLTSRVNGKIHKNALLAIGFIAGDEYYLNLIQINNNVSLNSLRQEIVNKKTHSEKINVLFENEVKIAIFDSKGNEVDYFEFFKNNKDQTFPKSEINPLGASCASYFHGVSNE